jgi:hypothetical protein
MNATLKKIGWRMLGADGLADWRRYNDRGLHSSDVNPKHRPKPQVSGRQCVRRAAFCGPATGHVSVCRASTAL